MEASEAVCYALIPILLAIASIGGIGGGIILLPLLVGIFHFKAKEAIPITSALVFLAAFIRFVFFSAHQGHPERPGATVVDYKLVKTVFPTFLVGGYFGVLVSVGLGELVLSIILMVILTALSIKVFFKGTKMYAKETIDHKQLTNTAPSAGEPEN